MPGIFARSIANYRTADCLQAGTARKFACRALLEWQGFISLTHRIINSCSDRTGTHISDV